jgi:hypothetical protein
MAGMSEDYMKKTSLSEKSTNANGGSHLQFSPQSRHILKKEAEAGHFGDHESTATAGTHM